MSPPARVNDHYILYCNSDNMKLEMPYEYIFFASDLDVEDEIMETVGQFELRQSFLLTPRWWLIIHPRIF